MNGVSGCSGVCGSTGVVGGTGFLSDSELEKIGYKLKNIFHNNDIKSYNVIDDKGVNRVLTQEQYDNIYIIYTREQRKLKLNKINEKIF